MTRGYVYALRSETCPYVKIGRSNTLPYRRIAELDRDLGYGPFAPWKIISYLEVEDCVAAETFLHRSLRASHVRYLPPCRELFDLSPAKVLELFNTLPAAQIRGYDKVARLQTDGELLDLLRSILRTTGVSNFLEQQGVWSLSMFPSTAGGRYYTMSIDRHEVAYASLPRSGASSLFMFAVDPLISEYKPTRRWLRARSGRVVKGGYRSALERLLCVEFEGDLADAAEFLTLPGVRRALVAYWYDSLLGAIEAGRGSLHAKHHNLACVGKLAVNSAR